MTTINPEWEKLGPEANVFRADDYTPINVGPKPETIPWSLAERENAQNRQFRHDRLCMSLVKPVKQATRSEPAKELPNQWIGHSCVGNVYFKTLDGARGFAAQLGYEGIYL